MNIPNKTPSRCITRPKWNTIDVDVENNFKLSNLPKHETRVIYRYGIHYYVGIFCDDVRLNDNPEGEKYTGDFGFYTDAGDYHEPEHVSKWMDATNIVGEWEQ